MSDFAKSEAPPRVRTAAVAVPGMPGRYAEATESMKYQLSQRYRYVVRAARPMLGAKRSAALKARVRFRELAQVPDLDVGASAGMSALVASELPQRYQNAVRARPVQRSAALRAPASNLPGAGQALAVGTGASAAEVFGMSALVTPELPQRYRSGACAVRPVRGLRSVVLGAMPDEVLDVRRSAALKVRPGRRVPGQVLESSAGASEGRGWG